MSSSMSSTSCVVMSVDGDGQVKSRSRRSNKQCVFEADIKLVKDKDLHTHSQLSERRRVVNNTAEVNVNNKFERINNKNSFSSNNTYPINTSNTRRDSLSNKTNNNGCGGECGLPVVDTDTVLGGISSFDRDKHYSTFTRMDRHNHSTNISIPSSSYKDDESSSSSYYSTAEEDPNEDEPEELEDSPKNVAGQQIEESAVDSNFKSSNMSEPTKADRPNNLAKLQQSPQNFSSTKSEESNNSSIQKLENDSNLNALIREGSTITVTELQAVFDCLKPNEVATTECERLVDLLGLSQSRNDFQWALQKLGGLRALLFLYARVVEVCSDDGVQSKALSLVLKQLKNHLKITDSPPKSKYNLLRFVLNSEKSVFGFKTFLILINNCISPSGNKLLDYELLEICLLLSWRSLLSVRCTEAESPTGKRSLFECLLTIIRDLLSEKNVHREVNVALLKSKNFGEIVLAICHNAIFDSQNPQSPQLNATDALRISGSITAIFSELLAPADAYVAVCIVKCGLYPLLPWDLPQLPRKEDAFFVFQNRNPQGCDMSVREAQELLLDDFSLSSDSNRKLKRVDQLNNSCPNNEDIPEMVGHCKILNNLKSYNKNTFLRQQLDSFREMFHESLMEGLMSILLNTLAILPDVAFHSVLSSHLSPYLFVGFCSHPNAKIKDLALKLLSAYLSRIKDPLIVEFLKNKGFFLTGLYIQGCSAVESLITNICKGFGPVAYPLIVSLLSSDTAVNTVVQWAQNATESEFCTLLYSGLHPACIRLHRKTKAPSSQVETLLKQIVCFAALNPRNDTFRILLCPTLENTPQDCQLMGKIYQQATEFLRGYTEKALKKSEASYRILWLLEKSSASKFGHKFDKWLLQLYSLNIMEIQESEENEAWKYCIKKNKKRINYLLGVFLCRIFEPSADLDFKQNTIKTLLFSCPNLSTWLPKVLRSDEQIEKCFTAFMRIFMCAATKRSSSSKSDQGVTNSSSFQSLITENGNFTLTFQMPSTSKEINYIGRDAEDEVQLSEKAMRLKFEDILVNAGILSRTFSCSNFSADFKKFKILFDNTPSSGVSSADEHQCINAMNKIKNQLQEKIKAAESSGTFAHKTKILNAAYFDEVFDAVMKYAESTLDIVTKLRTRQEIEMEKKVSVREEDVFAKGEWWKIVEQMVHPKAPWYFPDSHSKFWALDQSEGPGRVRIRMKREQLKLHNRFVMSKYRRFAKTSYQPLEFLFSTEDDELISFPNIQTEIQLMRFCTRIIPGEEIAGEMILSADALHFIPESVKYRHENVDVATKSVIRILKRRYALEDRAAEVFFESRSFLFVFKNQKDREEFYNCLSVKERGDSLNSNIMESSLSSMTSQWVKGQISNFDYLMFLNSAAGRTYCDLMQYPVFPFVLGKYASHTLDLHAPQSYRELKKPMAIQDPSKEEHFLQTYNYLKRECDSAPFHYGSHYSNSGIVLHFLVRLPPYTQHFLKYQDGSFDIPDRSFHSVETTWRLASKESNTDFKEAIPEFYYLPEFLKNLQYFDLGVRQNGQRVDEVVLPPWAKDDPRLFVLINRQALESNQVRKFLSDWIDLIFGYKQTGKAAIQAINVFHPSTYEGFEIDGEGDELLQRARKAMVSTYGQTPKKLFPYPHPRSTLSPTEKCNLEVIDTVWGLRWGTFLGSPACPELEVINTRQYQEPFELFETNSRIIFWPQNTVIIKDAVVGTWDASGIRIKSEIIYLCIGDEITACSTTDDSIWVGHQSGLILVLNLSPSLDRVVKKTCLVGHYQAIKAIDLNQAFSVAISCSGENYALVWDMDRLVYANTIETIGGIDTLYSSRATGDVIVFHELSNMLTLTTINGFHIGFVQPREKVESVCISGLDPGRNVNLVAVGCDHGLIRFYSTWDLKFINQIKVDTLLSLQIKSIRYSKDGKRLYCMSRTEDGSITAALRLPESNRK